LSSIIAPETPWGAKWQHNIRVISVFVKRRILVEVGYELFDSDVKSLEVISQFGVDDRSTTCLLHLLEEALSEPKGNSDLKIEHITRALAADVLRKYSAKRHKRLIAQGQLSSKQAKLVNDYIQQQLSSKILMKDLAALVGLGQTAFIQRFNASF